MYSVPGHSASPGGLGIIVYTTFKGPSVSLYNVSSGIWFVNPSVVVKPVIPVCATAVQENVAPAVVLDNATAVVVPPVKMYWSSKPTIFVVGLTVMVKGWGVPEQSSNIGVTVTSALIGWSPLLVAVNVISSVESTTELVDDDKPTASPVTTQVYEVAPPLLSVSKSIVVSSWLQTTISSGWVTCPNGLTVMTISNVPVQPSADVAVTL